MQHCFHQSSSDGHKCSSSAVSLVSENEKLPKVRCIKGSNFMMLNCGLN